MGTNAIPRVLSLLLLVLLAGIADAATNRIRTYRIMQLDFGRRGTESFIPSSDWGRLTLTYTGARSVMYLNLTINGEWVIQNVPVLSESGAERMQSVAVSFGLGIRRGQRIDRATHGITLTESIRKTPPPSRGVARIGHEVNNERCEVGDDQRSIPPAGPVVGGAVQDDKKHTIPNAVNQESPDKGCIPTALSNSLKTLKKNHNLDINNNDISIDALGTAVDYKSSSGTPAGWIDKKKDHITSKGLPIETTLGTIKDLPKAIDDKCDVEIRGGTPEWGHVAMVVGVAKRADGKYAIDIAHDTAQNENGGTTTESIVYDPATNTFDGGAWLKGTKLQEVVIECPKRKK